MRTLQLASVRVDLERSEVITDDGVLRLTPKEAAIFAYLLEHAGRDVTRDEVYQAVWGYRRGAVSRTLDTTVHRLRGKIEANASDPVHLRTVHGVGYRLVLQREPPPRMADAPNTGASAHAIDDLGLHGRDDELERLLAIQGAVLVVGPVGMGKTMLLQAAAAAVRGVWIDGNDDDDALATALGGADADWVFVDDVPSVGPATARAARAHPGRVVLASRSTAGWAGPTFPLGPLERGPSGALLAERVRALSPAEATDHFALERIAASAEHIPGAVLAIAPTIALLGRSAAEARFAVPGAFVEICPCSSVADRLREDWSRLCGRLQHLLIHMAWLGDEVELALVEAVCAGAASGLGSLYEQGWITNASTPGRVRMYRHICASVRELAGRARLVEADARVLAFTQVQAPRIVRGELRHLLPVPVLLQAYRGVHQRLGLPDDGEWIGAFDHLLGLRGRTDEHEAFLDEALTGPVLDEPIRRQLLHSRVRLALHNRRSSLVGDVEAILASSGADGNDRVRALGALAIHQQQAGHEEAADAALQAMLAEAAATGMGRGHACTAEGLYAYYAGDLHGAAEVLKRAHHEAIDAGDLATACDALVRRAVVASDLGETVVARLLLEQAEALDTVQPAPLQVSMELLRGRLTMTEGDLVAARRHHLRVAELAAEVGMWGASSMARSALVWIELALDDVPAAQASASEAVDLWGAHRNGPWLGTAYMAQAMVHLVRSQARVALAEIDLAVEHLGTDRRNVALALAQRALAWVLLGDDAAALEVLAEARRRAGAPPHDPVVTASIEAVACFASGQSDCFGRLPQPYRAVLDRVGRGL